LNARRLDDKKPENVRTWRPSIIVRPHPLFDAESNTLVTLAGTLLSIAHFHFNTIPYAITGGICGNASCRSLYRPRPCQVVTTPSWLVAFGSFFTFSLLKLRWWFTTQFEVEYEYYFACTRKGVHLSFIMSPGSMIFAVLPAAITVALIQRILKW